MAVPATNFTYLWNTLVTPRLGRAPYSWGGSFSPTDPTIGTDCSGAVSAELSALVRGPGCIYNRQFWTGTFTGINPGQTGPFGGIADTAGLICIAQPTDAPADYAMIIAVRQRSDPEDAHMICRVGGIDIEMGGNEFTRANLEVDYHTSQTNPDSNTVLDADMFNQWFYLPGPVAGVSGDYFSPPVPGLVAAQFL